MDCDGGPVGQVRTAATLALYPFSVVATLIDPYLRGFPEWIDISVTFALGLVPYAILDALSRWGAGRILRTP